MPRRVTDRETLQKFKAEFPQLELELGANPHVASHRSYAGARRDFDWGAIPAAAEAAGAPATAASAPALSLDPEPGPDRSSRCPLAAAAMLTDAVAIANVMEAAPAQLASEDSVPNETDPGVSMFCWGATPGPGVS